MMFRSLLTVASLAVATLTASADFNITGNPANDAQPLKGAALGVGNYVRSTNSGVFSYNFYANEFLLSPTNALATMANAWSAGDRVLMLGGVMTPGVTANSLGWSGAPGNTALNPANQRVNAKFGVATSGPAPQGNVYSASPVAPPVAGAPGGPGGLGSHGSGNGGYGSIQVSIGGGNMVTANAGLLRTPAVATGDNVAQYFGITSGGGFGLQGLDLVNAAGLFQLARYMFTVDGSGNLASWEVFVNATLAANYVSPTSPFPGAYGIVPTGGKNWVQTVQNGSGASSDSLVLTDVFSVPAPPALLMAGFGGLTLGLLRRVRK